MPRLSLNVDIYNRHVLVVGGGNVAYRKVRSLLETAARVHIVARSLVPELETLRKSGDITVRTGSYTPGDLAGMFLVVAASGNMETNREIARDALERCLLVNVINAPELGNCHFPAILRKGDLEIAVSTAGTCPAFSAIVRDYLAGFISDDFGSALETLAADRKKRITEGKRGARDAKTIRSHARSLLTALSQVKDFP